MNFTLHAVSQDLFDKMLLTLKQQGSTIGTPTPVAGNGKQLLIEGQGVKANVIYYSEAQMATVSILDKPWWAPLGVIEQKVRDALAIARA